MKKKKTWRDEKRKKRKRSGAFLDTMVVFSNIFPLFSSTWDVMLLSMVIKPKWSFNISRNTIVHFIFSAIRIHFTLMRNTHILQHYTKQLKILSRFAEKKRICYKIKFWKYEPLKSSNLYSRIPPERKMKNWKYDMYSTLPYESSLIPI